MLAGQVGYWQQALAGLPEELVLPFDRPRPAEPSQRGAVVRWRLADAGLHAALAGLAREHQATVFMVLHAAWRRCCPGWAPGPTSRSALRWPGGPMRRCTTWSGSS